MVRITWLSSCPTTLEEPVTHAFKAAQQDDEECLLSAIIESDILSLMSHWQNIVFNVNIIGWEFDKSVKSALGLPKAYD